MSSSKYTVVDLFSGAGGMSCGFACHDLFQIVGAVDAQNGKPSSGKGTLECNKTYATNLGIAPLEADISSLKEEPLRAYIRETTRRTTVDVLISCAPCTGFSRTIRRNLVEDDPRNSLVLKSISYVEWLKPKIFLMENVGELIDGKFGFYYRNLKSALEKLGYCVRGEVHSLDHFGLAQKRKRALVIGVKKGLEIRDLSDLWAGYCVDESATHVRRAIEGFPKISAGETDSSDPMHTSPNFSDEGLRRLQLIPHDGGSWPDLLRSREGTQLLIPSMQRYVAQGKVGPHPDVYGRMAWDAPSVTLKRECAHTGNGRYAHPDQDRLCTVREMASIQGFPTWYTFVASSQSNMYRHIGDAVPPLVSYQLACVCEWILTGRRPTMESIVLDDTHLKACDIRKLNASQLKMAGI